MRSRALQAELKGIVYGFWMSQCVYVAATLGIADRLKDGPKTCAELAGLTRSHPAALCRLLRALASIGIFSEDENGRFMLTPLAELLRTDTDGSMHAAGWERVPQLALLRRASVMVTHGGLNSIMECIHFGVPMVIVPGLRDQPGNATRADHHSLAVTMSMARITPETLVALAARAMEDSGIRQGLARMKREIANEKGLEANIKFIKSFPESPSGSRNSV